MVAIRDDLKGALFQAGLCLAPGRIVFHYETLRATFPGKHFPRAATLERMTAVVVSFMGGVELVSRPAPISAEFTKNWS